MQGEVFLRDFSKSWGWDVEGGRFTGPNEGKVTTDRKEAREIVEGGGGDK